MYRQHTKCDFFDCAQSVKGISIPDPGKFRINGFCGKNGKICGIYLKKWNFHNSAVKCGIGPLVGILVVKVTNSSLQNNIFLKHGVYCSFNDEMITVLKSQKITN